MDAVSVCGSGAGCRLWSGVEGPAMAGASGDADDYGLGAVMEASTVMSVVSAARYERVVVFYERAMAAARAGAGAGGLGVAERGVRLELASALRITERAADRLLSVADGVVRRYPVVLTSLKRAGMTAQHAEVLVDGLVGVDPEVAGVLVDRAVVLAEEFPVGVFRRELRKLVDAACAVTLTERYRGAVRERRVVVQAAEDGMAWLMAYLPAVEAHAIYDRLTKIAKAITAQEQDHHAVSGEQSLQPGQGSQPELGSLPAQSTPSGQSSPSGQSTPSGQSSLSGQSTPSGQSSPSNLDDVSVGGEARSRDQVRADALADLLIDGETSSAPVQVRGIRATVAVTVPVLSLLTGAPDHGPATVEGVGPIPLHRARELCGTASGWMRVLTHPETGVVVSVGRTQYRPPQELRRLVQWRADRCMAPGCGIPASRCEIDHTIAWEHGGTTALTNLAPLCKGHHTVKHHTDWRVEQIPDTGGALRWTSPAGRTYSVQPERRTPTFR